MGVHTYVITGIPSGCTSYSIGQQKTANTTEPAPDSWTWHPPAVSSACNGLSGVLDEDFRRGVVAYLADKLKAQTDANDPEKTADAQRALLDRIQRVLDGPSSTTEPSK